jgi:hypothetical protein
MVLRHTVARRRAAREEKALISIANRERQRRAARAAFWLNVHTPWAMIPSRANDLGDLGTPAAP